jgi:hypothetical protein
LGGKVGKVGWVVVWARCSAMERCRAWMDASSLLISGSEEWVVDAIGLLDGEGVV